MNALTLCTSENAKKSGSLTEKVTLGPGLEGWTGFATGEAQWWEGISEVITLNRRDSRCEDVQVWNTWQVRPHQKGSYMPLWNNRMYILLFIVEFIISYVYLLPVPGTDLLNPMKFPGL